MTDPDSPSSTDPAEIEALIARLKQSNLSDRDALLIERLLRLLLQLIRIVERKNFSIARLKRLLFGPRSDTRTTTTGTADQTPDDQSNVTNSTTSEKSGPSLSEAGQKRRGHGRRSSAAHTGAQVIPCQDPQLKAGSACPKNESSEAKIAKATETSHARLPKEGKRENRAGGGSRSSGHQQASLPKAHDSPVMLIRVG